MAFTYNLATPVGLTRFRLGDTVQGNGPRPDRRNFSDEEIQAMLDQTGDIEGAIAVLTSVLAAEWAPVPDFTYGGRKESFSQVSKAYHQAALDAGVGTSITFTAGFVRKDAYSDEK